MCCSTWTTLLLPLPQPTQPAYQHRHTLPKLAPVHPLNRPRSLPALLPLLSPSQFLSSTLPHPFHFHLHFHSSLFPFSTKPIFSLSYSPCSLSLSSQICVQQFKVAIASSIPHINPQTHPSTVTLPASAPRQLRLSQPHPLILPHIFARQPHIGPGDILLIIPCSLCYSLQLAANIGPLASPVSGSGLCASFPAAVSSFWPPCERR